MNYFSYFTLLELWPLWSFLLAWVIAGCWLYCKYDIDHKLCSWQNDKQLVNIIQKILIVILLILVFTIYDVIKVAKIDITQNIEQKNAR